MARHRQNRDRHKTTKRFTHSKAICVFKSQCENPESMFNKYPEDFLLHHIGEFNELTGELIAITPKVLATASSFVQKIPENIPAVTPISRSPKSQSQQLSNIFVSSGIFILYWSKPNHIIFHIKSSFFQF